MKNITAFVFAALLLLPVGTMAASSSSVTTEAGTLTGARPYKQTFTSSGTFTPLTDIIYISGCGAGSGGAGGHSADPGGGGGGGSSGQCVVRMPVYLSALTDLTITIGTAGVGGAAGAVGGTTNLDTTIAGLPIGTYTIMGGHPQTGATTSATFNVPGFGTVTNGGVGGASGGSSGGATATGAGAACGSASIRSAGGDTLLFSTGASGGGATGPGAGGACFVASGYNASDSAAGAAASGTKGGGGHGGNSALGIGGAGGSNAVGATCTVGHGSGGGGGAPTFAGGNGCPGIVRIEWWK